MSCLLGNVKSFWEQFLQARWPNHQRQSTEGSQLTTEIGFNPTTITLLCYNMHSTIVTRAAVLIFPPYSRPSSVIRWGHRGWNIWNHTYVKFHLHTFWHEQLLRQLMLLTMLYKLSTLLTYLLIYTVLSLLLQYLPGHLKSKYYVQWNQSNWVVVRVSDLALKSPGFDLQVVPKSECMFVNIYHYYVMP